MFYRLGAGHQMTVGFRVTRDLIFNICNLLMADHEENHEPTPDTWYPQAAGAEQIPEDDQLATSH